jgi:predicted amidohydrolase YtcJ
MHAPEYSTPWLGLGPLKLFKDGSLGARTATLRAPYLDDPGNTGVEAMSAAQVDAMMAAAALHRVQVITHAIGDRAVSDMLDAYEKVLPPDGSNPLRHSIVHYQCLDPDIIARTKKLGVIAQVQPIFLNTDIHAVGSRFSPQMIRWFLPFKSCLAAGLHLSFGSDCPVEDCNPFLGLHAAVNRQDSAGQPPEGLHPEENLDVAAAVDCFTRESAYAEFQEDTKGRIAEGYLADFVVLDRDIFTCDRSEIRAIRPVETIVGGKTTYQA